MALLNTDNRHQAIIDAARRYEIEHLVDPDLRQIGMATARLAQEMLSRIRKDDPELTRALNMLADARDAFMRAMVYGKRGRMDHMTVPGEAGSAALNASGGTGI